MFIYWQDTDFGKLDVKIEGVAIGKGSSKQPLIKMAILHNASGVLPDWVLVSTNSRSRILLTLRLISIRL